MTPITDAATCTEFYHGTCAAILPAVLAPGSGLNRMGRQHVHFATARPGVARSGIRTAVPALIHVDLGLALRAGMQVWRSANDVGLSAGLSAEAIAAGEAALAAAGFDSAAVAAGSVSPVSAAALRAAAAASASVVAASAVCWEGCAAASSLLSEAGESTAAVAAASGGLPGRLSFKKESCSAGAMPGAGRGRKRGAVARPACPDTTKWVPWWVLDRAVRRSDNFVLWKRGWPMPVGLEPGAGAPVEGSAGVLPETLRLSASRRATDA